MFVKMICCAIVAIASSRQAPCRRVESCFAVAEIKAA